MIRTATSRIWLLYTHATTKFNRSARLRRERRHWSPRASIECALSGAFSITVDIHGGGLIYVWVAFVDAWNFKRPCFRRAAIFNVETNVFTRHCPHNLTLPSTMKLLFFTGVLVSTIACYNVQVRLFYFYYMCIYY